MGEKLLKIVSGEFELDWVAWAIIAGCVVFALSIVVLAGRLDWSIRVAMLALAPWSIFFWNRPYQRWLISLAILSLAATAIFFRLGEGTLYDWDEGYYAQITRELLTSGEWGRLTFGGTPYWRKPPLYVWISALVSQIAGDNEFSIRFLSAVSGLTVVSLTLFFGARLFTWGVGAGAALLLLAVEHRYFSQWYNFISQSRAAALETTLTLFVLLSLILVWEARKRPEIISWIGLTAGLAVMTKSWAGFAAFGLPLIYSVALRQFGKQFRYWVFAILLLAAVILPWHVWQLWINGLPFIHDYFVVNVFGRMFGLVQQETRGPFFYLDILHRGFPVFAYAAVCALVWAIWTLPKKDHPQKLLLLTWIVVPLLVFSMAKTKLGWYIILIYPAVAILIAQAVSELAGERLALGATAAAMALLSFRLPVPTNASVDLKLFAAETRQIVGSADPLYVYSQEPCSTPGTVVAYDQSGIFSIPPSLVYYFNRKLSCTNAARPSELPLGSYVVADLKLLAEAETFDHIILQRGRFVLGTSTARNQRGDCNDEMGRCRRDDLNLSHESLIK